ncbi:MAG: AAA family ATPase [Gallionella sp.]|nr:AAA family ATPase [Gallionella sp.]
MSLKKFSYSEFEGDQRKWEFERTEFGNVNLLVGRNSTGKSRVLNVIASVCKVISGQQVRPFTSGRFDIEVEIGGELYAYLITFKDNLVMEEHLTVDGFVRLTRDLDGKGQVYFASEDRDIRFQITNKTIAIQNKNDRLQHPFIHHLYEWASGVALYNFGSDFGKNRLMARPPNDLLGSIENSSIGDVDNTVGIYINAFSRFSHDFDHAVIRDMSKLGYHLEEVAAEQLDNIGLNSPLLGLITVERDLGALRNPQLSMSQGMFRALALIIHLNLAIFSHDKKLLLIDDIGEGLDYERASAIIDLIISAAEKEHIQVLMTSNDRFVMNRVPLDYWAVLERTGKLVKTFTPKNSPNEFENFKFIGLSNFDFFQDIRFQ